VARRGLDQSPDAAASSERRRQGCVAPFRARRAPDFRCDRHGWAFRA
jgi:hypothetical protein